MIMRRVVVLPAPFGPRKPTMCPLGISKEMSLTAFVWPKCLIRFCTWIMGSFWWWGLRRVGYVLYYSYELVFGKEGAGEGMRGGFEVLY